MKKIVKEIIEMFEFKSIKMLNICEIYFFISCDIQNFLTYLFKEQKRVLNLLFKRFNLVFCFYFAHDGVAYRDEYGHGVHAGAEDYNAAALRQGAARLYRVVKRVGEDSVDIVRVDPVRRERERHRLPVGAGVPDQVAGVEAVHKHDGRVAAAAGLRRAYRDG